MSPYKSSANSYSSKKSSTAAVHILWNQRFFFSPAHAHSQLDPTSALSARWIAKNITSKYHTAPPAQIINKCSVLLVQSTAAVVVIIQVVWSRREKMRRCVAPLVTTRVMKTYFLADKA